MPDLHPAASGSPPELFAGMVSIVWEIDGQLVESASVGREGMVGLLAYLGAPVGDNACTCYDDMRSTMAAATVGHGATGP